MIKILMVCLGNICRSPMAQYLMQQQINNKNLQNKHYVASAGTSGWHDGEFMHKGTDEVLNKLQIFHADFVSSKISVNAIEQFDYLIAMDDDNLSQLESLFGHQPKRIFKITDLVPKLNYYHVPDPWYTGDFNETQRILMHATTALLDIIQGEN